MAANQFNSIVHVRFQFSMWSCCTITMPLIVKKMTIQISFVEHQPLVFVDAATIHHEMMGFVLHPRDYKAFSRENNSFTSSLLGYVFFNCVSVCVIDSASLGGNTK